MLLTLVAAQEWSRFWALAGWQEEESFRAAAALVEKTLLWRIQYQPKHDLQELSSRNRFPSLGLGMCEQHQISKCYSLFFLYFFLFLK